MALICVGGGRGARFGGNKLAEELAGRTVLEHSVAALKGAYPTAPLIVVVPDEDLDFWNSTLTGSFESAVIVRGGRRRQDSVKRGVEAAAATGVDVVAVHDAARPLVDPRDVVAAVTALGDADGAVLCQRVSDTVKRVDGAGTVVATVPRDDLRLALTPQVFRVAALRRAWDAVDSYEEWTDEAAILEAAGMEVCTVVAGHPNPKLTTAEDLSLIRALRGERR